jgi:uncharacterized membrane protein
VPPSAFVQLQQVIHIQFVRMMPPLILSAVGGALTWTVLLRDSWQAAQFWLVAGASLAMLGVLVMTRAVNVPINDRLMTWNVAAPPGDLAAQWRPWERTNSIRTVLAFVALVLEVLGLRVFVEVGAR